MSLDELVFVGFNSRVLALDRETGEIVWTWQAAKPKNGGYVTMLLDGDRLVVSVNGYMYCIDPANGEQLWFNETKGFGTGVASIASVRGQSAQSIAAVVAEAQQQAAAAAAAAGS
jgi:outer membrane protein assembly factor BamB